MAKIPKFNIGTVMMMLEFFAFCQALEPRLLPTAPCILESLNPYALHLLRQKNRPWYK